MVPFSLISLIVCLCSWARWQQGCQSQRTCSVHSDYCQISSLIVIHTQHAELVYRQLQWAFSSIMRSEVINQCHINHQSVPGPWTKPEEHWPVFHVQSCAQPRSFMSPEKDISKTTPDPCLWALKEIKQLQIIWSTIKGIIHQCFEWGSWLAWCPSGKKHEKKKKIKI